MIGELPVCLDLFLVEILVELLFAVLHVLDHIDFEAGVFVQLAREGILFEYTADASVYEVHIHF